MKRIRIRLHTQFVNGKGGGVNFAGETIGIEEDVGRALIARGAAVEVASISSSRRGPVQAPTTKPAPEPVMKVSFATPDTIPEGLKGYEKTKWLMEAIRDRGGIIESSSHAALEANLERLCDGE